MVHFKTDAAFIGKRWVLYITHVRMENMKQSKLWKGSLHSDGQQLHEYQ
jgi:hypothetical protein